MAKKILASNLEAWGGPTGIKIWDPSASLGYTVYDPEVFIQEYGEESIQGNTGAWRQKYMSTGSETIWSTGNRFTADVISGGAPPTTSQILEKKGEIQDQGHLPGLEESLANQAPQDDLKAAGTQEAQLSNQLRAEFKGDANISAKVFTGTQEEIIAQATDAKINPANLFYMGSETPGAVPEGISGFDYASLQGTGAKPPPPTVTPEIMPGGEEEVVPGEIGELLKEEDPIVQDSNVAREEEKDLKIASEEKQTEIVETQKKEIDTLTNAQQMAALKSDLAGMGFDVDDNGGLIEKPALPQYEDSFEALRSEQGVAAIETRMNELDKAIADTSASLRLGLYDEEGKLKPMELIGTAQRELQRQGQEQLDALNREKQVLVNEYNTKMNLINNIMTLKQMDYAAASADYNNRFNQAITLLNIVEGRQDKAEQRANQQIDDARANLTLLTGLAQESGQTWGDLDPSMQSQITQLESQANLPTGIIQAFLIENPDTTIDYVTSGYDEEGNEVVSFFSYNNGDPKLIQTLTGGSYKETQKGTADLTASTLVKDYFTGDQILGGAANANMTPSEFSNLTVDEANKYITEVDIDPELLRIREERQGDLKVLYDNEGKAVNPNDPRVAGIPTLQDWWDQYGKDEYPNRKVDSSIKGEEDDEDEKGIMTDAKTTTSKVNFLNANPNAEVEDWDSLSDSDKLRWVTEPDKPKDGNGDDLSDEEEAFQKALNSQRVYLADNGSWGVAFDKIKGQYPDIDDETLDELLNKEKYGKQIGTKAEEKAAAKAKEAAKEEAEKPFNQAVTYTQSLKDDYGMTRKEAKKNLTDNDYSKDMAETLLNEVY